MSQEINLRERVSVKLTADLPSMGKKKGEEILTHPLNVDKLKKKLAILYKEASTTKAEPTSKK
jgi:uncharacterized small protein (DUF1192 family)